MGDPRRSRRFGHRFGALGVQAGESLTTGLVEDAHQIDDAGRAIQRPLDRGGNAQIGLHQLNLADHTHHAQILGQVRTARSDTNAITGFRQGPDNMAADKAGAAEYGDDLVTKHGCSSGNPLM